MLADFFLRAVPPDFEEVLFAVEDFERLAVEEADAEEARRLFEDERVVAVPFAEVDFFALGPESVSRELAEDEADWRRLELDVLRVAVVVC